ncbi:UDP-N-acetylmuramoyl-tripeptide--D-alanyl-D-alanine ligase [Oxalobacteraceae bacterium A2-2]
MRASLSQIVAAIPGATLVNAGGAELFTGVSTDSRTVGRDALFVALVGETFDAHDFLPQVAQQGVAAVVAQRLPDGWTLPAIVVPDTLAALGRIGHYWRSQFDIPVIGVTGSNGKTTVKEMIAAILAAAYGEEDRLATRGNLNNEIGVPLTLFRLLPHHSAAVVEMGMNHPGEIARLAAIAEPTVAMVNNAQREHQEFMHTVEAVARENGAVLAALPADGVAVFPHGDEYTPVWEELAGARRRLRFGLSKEAEVSCTFRAGDFESEIFVTLRDPAAAPDAEPQQFFIRLQAAGEHNVRNALAAAACTWAAGVPLHAIKLGLDSFVPVSGRLQRKQAANGALLIDDSYNANPDSVRAAIDVLAKAPSPRVLVLGDMGEVGSQGREFHQEIGAYAHSKGIEQVLVTGELAAHMQGQGAAIRHFEQFGDLLSAVDAAVTPVATVLIKGSRFMKMERVVQHLIGSQQANKEHH